MTVRAGGFRVLFLVGCCAGKKEFACVKWFFVADDVCRRTEVLLSQRCFRAMGRLVV